MKVVVVGSGGREHALCWKIAQSKDVSEVVCAPGNAGTAETDGVRNVDVGANDIDGLLSLAKSEDPGLIVIGPEDPLCAGLADKLRAAGFLVFGPGADGARLEGSKTYSKDFLDKQRIPTAAARQFDRSGLAKGYLDGVSTWPLVVKADGLAAGKGVYVCQDSTQARAAVDAIMEEGRHGKAGGKVLVEEFMEGEEASVFAITDGSAILILEAVEDHKQVGEGDLGPNTGGMGVYSPVTTLNKRLHKQIEQRILIPTVHGLRQGGIEFRGVLFVGLMLTDSGPRVIEYNVRFGDPECQALMRRFRGDLVPILVAAADGRLDSVDPPNWDARHVVGVVAASQGYPGDYRKGDAISGIELAEQEDDVVVFHAGTKLDGAEVLTNGGRVLCVTALADDIETARSRAYAGYDKIAWDGKFCRRDIGTRAASRPPREVDADDDR